MTDERKALAKKVKAYRKEHDINQMEFAEECGISDVSLCRIERQNSNVSLDTMQLIAARMGESVSRLLSDNERFTYCLIPSLLDIDGKEITTYGIGVLKDNILLNYCLDISTNFNKVLSLMDVCDKAQVEEIHLHDIAEDFLVE